MTTAKLQLSQVLAYTSCLFLISILLYHNQTLQSSTSHVQKFHLALPRICFSASPVQSRWECKLNFSSDSDHNTQGQAQLRQGRARMKDAISWRLLPPQEKSSNHSLKSTCKSCKLLPLFCFHNFRTGLPPEMT